MVQPASASKNIWVAASDGDLDRYLIEEQGLSANVKDSNSYTPMHAAASYSHLDLLTYLLSRGGDINIVDAEGETPLFTVESEGTARWMVEHGADPAHENDEGQTVSWLSEPPRADRGGVVVMEWEGASGNGYWEGQLEGDSGSGLELEEGAVGDVARKGERGVLCLLREMLLFPTYTPPTGSAHTVQRRTILTAVRHLQAADFLHDDHAETSTYLRSLLTPPEPPTDDTPSTHSRPGLAGGAPSQLALEEFASGQTSELLEESRRIMLAAEASGEDPEPRLRELVEKAVREGISFGGQVGDGIELVQEEGKRRRTNGDGAPGE